jgi:predicted nucleotide-binding protein (sugar kinase/HSP70/actin superfamily)
MMGKLEQERERYTAAAKQANEQLDKKADEIVTKGEEVLAKAKKSRWTGVMLIGATVAGAIATFLMIK